MIRKIISLLKCKSSLIIVFIFLLILLSLLFLLSCNKLEKGALDELFFIENESALLPVWVRGNSTAGTFLLILHGGPGGSAFDYVDKEIKEQL